MRLTKISAIVTIATVILIASCFTVYIYLNNIKADSIQTVPVVSENDLQVSNSDMDTVEPDNRRKVSVPILMYHYIRDYNNPSDTIGTNLSVSPINFQTQIDYIKNNGYTTITFNEFNAFPQAKLPEKPIIITFDDGYDDAFKNAYRLLNNNGQKAVFYLISSKINTPGYLNSSQIVEMASNNMEIGAHTVNHPDLSQKSSEIINYELTESKKNIELIIGKNVNSFCYPFGKYNDEIITAVINAGFTSATTTNNKISSTDENKMSLSRVRVSGTDSLSSFSSKLLTKNR